jgi:hypothetical protein
VVLPPFSGSGAGGYAAVVVAATGSWPVRASLSRGNRLPPARDVRYSCGRENATGIVRRSFEHAGSSENRFAPARSKYARLESNQRPLPSHGSALVSAELRAFVVYFVSVVGAALPPFGPGSAIAVLRGGVVEPGVRRVVVGGAFLSWEGPWWGV